MIEFLLSFLILIVAFASMAIGLIFAGKTISPCAHGDHCPESDRANCSACPLGGSEHE